VGVEELVLILNRLHKLGKHYMTEKSNGLSLFAKITGQAGTGDKGQWDHTVGSSSFCCGRSRRPRFYPV
jgi:hypothetical protein